MSRLIELPKGKRVQDVLPQFAAVVNMVATSVGEPCPFCPGCSKPFTAARKPGKQIIRLYPVLSPIPIAVQYRLCVRCLRNLRSSGSQRHSTLAAIECFMGISGGNDGD